MNKIAKRGGLDKLLVSVGLIGIVCTYLFQEFSFLTVISASENFQFVLKKTFRVVLNDFFMLIFIASWFKDWRITRLAIAIQLVDGIILLPIYLVVKLSMEGTSEISSPLLSQLHRLIINPTLMILLVPAVYFQKLSQKKE